MSKPCAILLLLVLGVVTVGCGGAQQETPAPAKKVRRAMAYIDPKSGSELMGTAIFINEPGQVSLQIDIENAPPGEHAVHLHEFGDCGADDGKSAGGHWNPTTEEHGKWGEAPFHLGDIGNIKVGSDGKGSLTMSTDRWSMGTGEANDVVGKSIIVHEKQ